MKRLVLAIAVVLAIVIAAFTGSAMADTITGYSGYGMNSTVGGSVGPGLYGMTWSWNNNGAGGNSAWGTPGLGAGTLTWSGPTTDDFAFILGTQFGVPAGTYIDSTPAFEATGYDTTTRFSVDVAGTWTLWTATFIPSPSGADEVHFYAPAGADLVAGDQYFVNVALTAQLPI